MYCNYFNTSTKINILTLNVKQLWRSCLLTDDVNGDCLGHVHLTSPPFTQYLQGLDVERHCPSTSNTNHPWICPCGEALVFPSFSTEWQLPLPKPRKRRRRDLRPIIRHSLTRSFLLTQSNLGPKSFLGTSMRLRIKRGSNPKQHPGHPRNMPVSHGRQAGGASQTPWSTQSGVGVTEIFWWEKDWTLCLRKVDGGNMNRNFV